MMDDVRHRPLLDPGQEAEGSAIPPAAAVTLHVRAFGSGDQTGPSPVDRRKKGTKHTLMVSRQGVPLKVRTAGANASDHTQIIPLVLDFPRVGGKPGRPKELPDELYADRGYDSDSTQWFLGLLGVDLPHEKWTRS